MSSSARKVVPILLALLAGSFFYTCNGYKIADDKCKIDRRMPTGSHYMKTSSMASNSHPGTIGIIGDVRDVLQGIVKDEARNSFWSGATTGPIGFGTGTVGPLDAVGEAVYVNGIAFVRSTNNGTRNYFRTVPGRTFRAQYSAFVTHGAVRHGQFMVNFRGTGKNLTLTDLNSEIHSAVGQKPFCFYGLTQFAQLDGIAISKAPVYGEPLFDAENSYYSMPNFALPNEFGFMMGCAANFQDITDPALLQKLSRNLYYNPLDNQSELTVHSHALGLSRCLTSVEEIDVSVVSGVYHMLSNATISVAKLNVFVIEGEESLVELSPRI